MAAQTWKWHHAMVFIITFFSYSAFFACRKSFSNIKNVWGKSFTPQNITCPIHPKDTWGKHRLFKNSQDADVFLAELDSVFLFAFSIAIFFSGAIGDRVNLRYFLTFGMCGSATLTFLFGYISEVVHMENLFYYRLLYFFNGSLQSCSLPAFVAVLGNWFGKSSSGLVFGLWGANDNTGNVMGSLVVVGALKYGYEYGILLNSAILFSGGIIVFFCLIPHPNDVGIESPDGRNKIRSHGESEEQAIGFFTALMLPRVVLYALSYGCLKMVGYSLLLWLPTYFAQGLHWSDNISGRLSTSYDIGSIIGGTFLGVITDLLALRSPPIYVTMLCTPLIVYVFIHVGWNYTANYMLLITLGFFLGGSGNTISMVVTAHLGKHKQVKGNIRALATVSGIIEGSGSLGGAFGQYAVGWLTKTFNWFSVFYFFIIMLICSIAFLTPIYLNDVKILFELVKLKFDIDRIPDKNT